MKTLMKRKSRAFGKDLYLLGELKGGELIWLEEAKFDCGWYWGFGYVETYTNNEHPELARDITSHSHFDGLCFKEIHGKYCRIIKDNPTIGRTPLSEAEQWELSDLMKTFYTLKDIASIYHSGNSHLTSGGKVDLTDEKENRRINEELMPKIFKRVYEILSPEEVK